MDGFFHDSAMVGKRKALPIVAQCGLCKLHTGCKSPKMDVSGSGRKGVMIVGEAPGKEEDDAGTQFIGRTGQYLQKHLRYIGVDLRRDCWSHNALSCRPGPDNKIQNKKMIEWCRPRVIDSITKYKPSVIILLGKTAVQSVLGHLWKEDVGGSKRWAGYNIPNRTPNAWVCCTYHPSFVNREKADAELYSRVYRQHLQSAFDLVGTRPWEEIPDEAGQVEITSPEVAAVVLRKWATRNCTIAFDFETDRLKPDDRSRKIVAAGVCYEGKKTIAFPWRGEAVLACRELLESPTVHKRAWNLQMEHRWCRRVLGCRVAWTPKSFDGMQAAHVLDCRPKISSLKFQAFVRRGVPDYAGRISPFLESKEAGGNAKNRIHEVELTPLLRYCGTDAYLTYHITDEQMGELGWSES